MDFLELVGKRIRNRILDGSFKTVEEFAFETEISKATLSEIINGKNNPKVTTLARIASHLGITLSELFQDPEINSWVREQAPHYRAKTPKPKLPKSAKKAAPKKRNR